MVPLEWTVSCKESLRKMETGLDGEVISQCVSDLRLSLQALFAMNLNLASPYSPAIIA